MAAISNDWLPVFQGEFRKPYYKQLYQTVMKEYNTRKSIPRRTIFSMRSS